MRIVGWFREQSEKLRLAEEEEAREDFEREEEAAQQARLALQLEARNNKKLGEEKNDNESE